MADYYAGDADTEQTPTKAAGSDAAILEELLERFDYASTQWAEIIAQADIDVLYAAGDTWNQDDRDARKGRPVENFDQLSQYSNQLVNSFRQNPRAAKLAPAGGGADSKSAELRANRIRQIEHDSHAQEVYTVAGENMVTRGYGYARIIAEYERGAPDPRSQVLRLKAVPNPNQVLPDPDAESTSGADWQYLFFTHTITKREFQRDYPTAEIKDFTPATIALAPKWFGKDGRVQIAEYWSVTETAPASGEGAPTRTVCMYLTNGVELLAKKGKPKKTEWKGTTIPFASAYGKIVYETNAGGDAQKMLQSYHRLARSAAKAYNWTKSTELEALALPVKASLFAYKGQLDQDQIDLVNRSTKEPVALIEANATTEATGTQVLPLPQYGTRAPDISSYEIAAESFRRDVQNALGRYSTQDARQGNTKVTSGVALDELRKSGDLGSYHFVAHYDDMVRELASKLEELLPCYDDTEKEIDTRKPDGSTERVWINRKTGRAPNGDPAYGKADHCMDPAHRHTVTISVGPAQESEREANSDFADHVIDSPQILQVVGPQKAAALVALAIKLKGAGAIGDQMAEIVDPQQKDGEADPRRLQQENAQLKGQLQQLEGIAKEMHEELKGKQAEIASKEKISAAELQATHDLELELQEKKNAAAIAIAHINADAKGASLVAHAAEEAQALGHEAATNALQVEHETTQAQLAREDAARQAAATQAHQAGMAAAGTAASADEAAAQRDHAVQMGDASHQQTLEQQQQAADLAPAPTDPSSA